VNAWRTCRYGHDDATHEHCSSRDTHCAAPDCACPWRRAQASAWAWTATGIAAAVTR
jgi:hypothetical protein